MSEQQRIDELRRRLGAPGATEAGLQARLQRHLDNPYVLVAIVMLGWGVSEYLLVLAGRELNWQTGIFYNCLGVVTINLFTMRSGNVDIFRFDKWVFYAVLTGVLYAIADVYFLKLSGNTAAGHLADVSVLAPLCSLFVLIPTILGIVVDREPVTARKVAGILLATASILILSLEEEAEAEIAAEEAG